MEVGKEETRVVIVFVLVVGSGQEEDPPAESRDCRSRCQRVKLVSI